MLFRVVLYFGILLIGAFFSVKGKIPAKVMEKVSVVQSVSLFILIFIMGINVGMNRQVVTSIGTIGLKAFVFSLLTAFFSVLFVFLARKKFINNKNLTGGN